MISSLTLLLAIGAIAGYLARFLVPGPDPMTLVQTVALGVAGSFVGGFLGWVIFGDDFGGRPFQPARLTGSIIGAIVALLFVNAWSGRRSSG